MTLGLYARMTTAASGLLVGLALAAPAAQAIQAPVSSGVRPEHDARAGERAAIPAATADARSALARKLGTQASVAADPVTGGLQAVGRTDGFLTGRSDRDPAAIGLAYVRDHADAFGLDGADLAQLHVASRSTAPDGVTHVTWRQSVDGVPGYDSALFANVTADGRLVNAGGAPAHDLALPSVDPPLGPGAARAAAQRDLGVATDAAIATIGTDAARTTRFSDGDTASLVALADPSGDHLAWKLIVEGADPYLYEVLVDAATGAILTRHSLTEFASAAGVVENHPGATAGGTPHAVDLASWLPASPTALSGPNAHAYADRTSPNGIGGDTETGPIAGSDFSYTTTPVAAGAGQYCPGSFTTPCTWDGATLASIATNVNEATTQLFYYVNKYHDWLAQPPIGFTTSSYNFQDADPVLAESDDNGGFNNANMSTPPDGSSPRMQMYLFRSPFPSVNGSDDASVVYHEYTHGLTNRLVGGDGQANGLSARQSRAMGEAWSDWYAADFLAEQGLITDGPAAGDVVEGEYVTDNRNVGIRENAIDCPVGSTDAVHCPGSPTAGPGGFTFGDLGRVVSASGNPYFEVHADGEIWAETLWDLRRAVGGATARSLVTGGLRLSPKQPSFLTMRDAILQADQVAGGANRAAIWKVFADRGMGYGAKTSSANAGVGAVSFATPPLAAAGAPAVVSPAPLGDGDAALEPGEAARVRVPVINPGTTALTNVRATLTATTAGVVVGRSTASYGTIAPGATGAADAPFAITVPATVPCATVLGLTLTVASDQGTAATVPLAIATGAGATATSSTDIPKAITDNNRASPAVSTLTLPAGGRVGHLRVTLSITHTYASDLHAWLTSPSGTVVNLLEQIGVTGDSDADGLDGVVLDDDAPTSIQDVPVSSSAPPVTGTWAPDDALSAVADEPRAGTWTLRVTDGFAADTGSLTAWSLSTDEPACDATGPALPSVATGDASAIGQSAATLAAAVAEVGTPTAGAFEYGTTIGYGTVAEAAGSGAVSAALTGLEPATTYHYRALALRDGTVVAVGADRTFTTAAAASGSDGGANAGGSGTPGPTTTTPTTLAAPATTPEALTISGLPSALTVDTRGRVRFGFSVARWAGASSGTITLKSAVKRVRTAGTGRFTIPASGKVAFRLTLSKAARAYLRSHRTLKVSATIRLGTATKVAQLTVKARRHR